MQLRAKALTCCEVVDDGETISLGFEDAAGQPIALSLSVSQAGALIMTLPGLLEMALRARYGDQALRYAYPLASWTIEQSTDAAQRIMTLATADGFSVRFAIPTAEQNVLGEALLAQYPTLMAVRPN
ncbi:MULTISPECIES: hypothetical protein [Bradyrhizobium]|jgi:hypothetical protein|uniref:Uncharacterized protein n=2 Tax=Bradyrhizobium TaxID=374 RepID=A0ABS5G6N8_9BRAD|nr:MULTISPECIES: hypothetical protein [Bradyrhizobium]RTL93439.1 MAG: hypothetical protein EKK32_28960 [Bradyrhizobiaceae bacterium]ABQ35922.1 hypothetical protein BBta_3846 [Bradyrhizobium sp. BTAi1]MBR1136719.1 hypothetical protein [Bradyrhizobium denitrificans]MCL8487520.1 hypothetical protein [Bradyrhizobium denitrificans]MDU0955230.1 hypothetical protein [Bradyrhizobium sp.]